MATPDEARFKIRKLRNGARFHGIVATLFVAGIVYMFLDRPTRRTSPGVEFEEVFQWEVAVMGFGLVIVNVFLALSKSRRASRLAVDPDADHPEAKVFE